MALEGAYEETAEAAAQRFAGRVEELEKELRMANEARERDDRFWRGRLQEHVDKLNRFQADISHVRDEVNRVTEERNAAREALREVGSALVQKADYAPDEVEAGVATVVEDLIGTWRAAQRDHDGACQTIAAMHAAAFGGETRGPARGVVEDVQDLHSRSRASEEALGNALRTSKVTDTLLHDAWGVIANVGLHLGSWEAQHPEWLAAAKRWRDRWHDHIGALPEMQPVLGFDGAVTGVEDLVDLSDAAQYDDREDEPSDVTVDPEVKRLGDWLSAELPLLPQDQGPVQAAIDALIIVRRAMPKISEIVWQHYVLPLMKALREVGFDMSNVALSPAPSAPAGEAERSA